MDKHQVKVIAEIIGVGVVFGIFLTILVVLSK